MAVAVVQVPGKPATITIQLPGIPGPVGPKGDQGPIGTGVPTGGVTGQMIVKVTDTTTGWVTATDIATASAVARRDASGNLTVNQLNLGATAPTVAGHATRKDYVDTQIGTRAALSHTHAAADIPDATTTTRGGIILANHLGGSAAAPTVRAATDTQTGIVELATSAETTAGTDATRAVTPIGLKAVTDTKANLTHTHAVADLTATGTRDATTFLRGDNTWAVPAGTGGGGTATVTDATTTAKGVVQLANHLGGTAAAPTVRSASDTQTGIVELATTAETTTGTSVTLATTPAGVKAVADTKANLAHGHATTDITNFNNSVMDIVGPAILDGTGTTVNYDATNHAVTVSMTYQESIATAAPWQSFYVMKDTVTGFWPTSYTASGQPVYTGGSASTGVRPTARNDIIIIWIGADPSPGSVTTGTGGMLAGRDQREIPEA